MVRNVEIPTFVRKYDLFLIPRFPLRRTYLVLVWIASIFAKNILQRNKIKRNNVS